jgi:TatD DNase family protein
VPYRGKTNEPAFVLHTAEKLAEVRGVTLEDIGRQTTANFFTLFSKAAA